jgi:hypothetical protein
VFQTVTNTAIRQNSSFVRSFVRSPDFDCTVALQDPTQLPELLCVEKNYDFVVVNGPQRVWMCSEQS